MSKENDKEEPEILTNWEKGVSKKLEKLDAMEQEIAEIKKLVTTKLEPAKVKFPKPAKATVKELIAKSTPFLGEFCPQKFVELATAEGLIGNANFSDQDIALLSSAIGEPLLILDEAERDEAISLLCKKLEIEPKRFEVVTKAQEEIWLSVDEEFWREETPATSEVEVVEKTVPPTEEES